MGKEAIKQNENLFGETRTDKFIKNLDFTFRNGIDRVSNDLINKTDLELGVLFQAYSPSVSNQGYYEPIIIEIVTRFESQILPIGPPVHHMGVGGGIGSTTHTGIVWAQVGNAEYLVQFNWVSVVTVEPRYVFVTFIDSDLKDPTIASQPGGILTLPSYAIFGFPSTIPQNATAKMV